MIDLGFVETNGAVAGSTYHFDWSKSRAVPPLQQQFTGAPDHLLIYNGSGVIFLATTDQSVRSFTIPANSWYGPLPISYRGTSDNSITLVAEQITPNQAIAQVHFDYFYPGEQVIIPQPLSGVPPLQSATFFASGAFIPAASGTWTNFSGVQNMSNWPFANSAITAGMATAGTFTLLLYGGLVTMRGFANDKTTVEGAEIHLRVAVQDSAAAIVSTFGGGGDGTFMNGYIEFVSGNTNGLLAYGPSQPFLQIVTVAAGAGPPYGLVPQCLIKSTLGFVSPNFGLLNISFPYAVQAQVVNGLP